MATKKPSLTDYLKAGKYVALDDVVGAGALEARLNSKGLVSFFWRIDIRPDKYRYKIGQWDKTASPLKEAPTDGGYTRADACAQAKRWAAIHLSPEWADRGGYPAKITHDTQIEAEAKEAAIQADQLETRQAIEQAKQEAIKRSFTLERLIIQYCERLASQGKQSAYDASGLLTKHVIHGRPDLAGRAANAIDGESFAELFQSIGEAHPRTANKARSYLRAAYTVAAKAKLSSKTVDRQFKGFEIKRNPVAETFADADANKADKNPLKGDEFIAYWHAIESLAGVKGHILRLHLLTGGQRIAQFCRLTKNDFENDALILRDPKGRRKTARLHYVPLTKSARIEFDALVAINAQGVNLISTDSGLTPCWPSTVSDYAKAAVAKHGQTDGFQLKRVRSGVETLLSGKVSKDIRAQLQSHGLGGVQQASYDANDYLPEKRHALELLLTLLNERPRKNVINLAGVR